MTEIIKTETLLEMILNNMETFKQVFENQEKIEQIYEEEMKNLRETLKRNPEYAPYFEILDNNKLNFTLAKLRKDVVDKYNEIVEEEYKEIEKEYIEANYPQYLPYTENFSEFKDKILDIIKKHLDTDLLHKLEENTEQYDKLLNDLNGQIGGLLQNPRITSSLVIHAFNFMYDLLQLLDVEKVNEYRLKMIEENSKTVGVQ